MQGTRETGSLSSRSRSLDPCTVCEVGGAQNTACVGRTTDLDYHMPRRFLASRCCYKYMN